MQCVHTDVRQWCLTIRSGSPSEIWLDSKGSHGLECQNFIQADQTPPHLTGRLQWASGFEQQDIQFYQGGTHMRTQGQTIFLASLYISASSGTTASVEYKPISASELHSRSGCQTLSLRNNKNITCFLNGHHLMCITMHVREWAWPSNDSICRLIWM